MPDGSLVEIDHLLVDIAKETLGVFTCPSGDASAQFLSMLQKGQKWIDRAVESHLQRRDIWFLLDHKLALTGIWNMQHFRVMEEA